MKVYYANDELKKILCERFMIISKNKKKSLLDILTNKKSPNEKEVAELNKYLTSIISKIGYKQDIEITNSDDVFIYGRIKDSNVYFHIPVNFSSGFKITTIEEDDTNYDLNTYYICVGAATYNNKTYTYMAPKKISSERKRGNQTTYKHRIDDHQVYDSLVVRGEKSVDCLINGTVSNKELLDEYFVNLDINKDAIQIFKEISKLGDLKIEELMHISILITCNNQVEECISFNDGKLVCLDYHKNGEGYYIHDGKIEIKKNKENRLYNYNIDYDEKDNAIITIGNNQYSIPLDILDYADDLEDPEVEEANRIIGKSLGKKMIERRESKV